MKQLVILVLFLCAFACCAKSSEQKVDDEQCLINNMLSNLQQSTAWIVRNGIASYMLYGEDAIREKLMNEWAVQLWVDPSVGTERFIALFQIKGRGIYCDIQCMSRMADESVYEYWHVMLHGEKWSGASKSCQFIVTETDRIDGLRMTIYQSDHFFSSYKISESLCLILPLDDNRLLYDLKAWEFPDSFPNSDIKNWEIRIDHNGRYVRTQAD